MNGELTKKCEQIRKKLIKVVSKNGGHLGPNLGVVELTVCLDKVFSREIGRASCRERV